MLTAGTNRLRRRAAGAVETAQSGGGSGADGPFDPLDRGHWLLVVGIALGHLVVVELDKALDRRRAAVVTP